MATPSSTLVNETCLEACKAMKLQSRQLLKLSASYDKIPFEKSGKDILETLNITIKSLNDIQNSLIRTGKIMNSEIEDNTFLEPIETVVVTKKEFILLNAVFREYTDVLTSNNFSIFSKSHGMNNLLGTPCQDKGEKSKDN